MYMSLKSNNVLWEWLWSNLIKKVWRFSSFWFCHIFNYIQSNILSLLHCLTISSHFVCKTYECFFIHLSFFWGNQICLIEILSFMTIVNHFIFQGFFSQSANQVNMIYSFFELVWASSRSWWKLFPSPMTLNKFYVSMITFSCDGWMNFFQGRTFQLSKLASMGWSKETNS